jgi:hypothetical protein
MITALANRHVKLIRRTSLVVAKTTVAASHTPAIQPSRQTFAKVEITGGTANTGTVTLAGSVGGAASTEAFTFTSAGAKIGKKQFTGFSGVTTSGFIDEATKPSIQVQMVDSGGSPHHGEDTLIANIPASLNYGSGDWPAQQQGPAVEGDVTIGIMWVETCTPRPGDVIEDNNTLERWFVRRVQLIRGSYTPHHWSLRCSKYDEG